MRLRDLLICFICLLLAAGLFIGSGRQLDSINNWRKEMHLVMNEPLTNAPPSLAFATVAMGAFRGLLVDILWMRTENMKEKGQFFDARQLAEWITVLQPRFTAVWEFQSWNMAYNISVAIPATQPEQRWRWVKNGYELLRDKGIVINPKSMNLHRQLALIFQHKLGGVTDDAHKYYKLKFASEMEPLLGAADKQFFQALTKAPKTLEQITKEPKIAQLVAALKSADKAFENDDYFAANYLSLRQNPQRFSQAAFEVINSFRNDEALNRFDIFAKAYEFRNVWKLDPVLMQQINEKYGPVDFDDPNNHLPLDWRHPDAHAIYWATKGLEFAHKDEMAEGQANSLRIIAHSLQNLFRNGKVFIYDVTDTSDPNYQPGMQLKSVYLRPDMRMFEPYNQSRLQMIKDYEGVANSGQMESFKTGHRNMLRNAILSFYLAGHIQQADRTLNQVQTLYQNPMDKYPLMIFVKNRLKEEMQSLGMDDFKEMVQLLLMEGYFQYAMHEDDEAAGREKMAVEIYDNFKATFSDVEKLQIPDIKIIRYLSLVDFFNDQQYPLVLKQNLLGRIKVEKPEIFKQLMEQEEILRAAQPAQP